MKVKCVRDDISAAVQAAQRIVSSRAIMPVLTGVVLKAADDNIQVLATDLELSINTGFSASVEESGQVVISARLLGDILKNLSAETVSLEKTGNDLEINDGKASFKLRTMPAEDFPALPEVEEPLIQEMESRDFINAVGQVKNAVSRDERRIILTGILFDLKEDGITLVGTDSYRLALRELTAKTLGTQENSVIVPGRALQEVGRWGDYQKSMDVFRSEGQIRFTQADRSLTARLIEGRFPNYSDFVPKQVQMTIRFSREEMEAAVRRMSLVAPTIVMKVENNNLTLESNASEVGEARETIAIQGADGGLEIAFNADYLKDGIGGIDGDQVEMLLTDAEKPALLKGTESDNYKYVIMPVRIKR